MKHYILSLICCALFIACSPSKNQEKEEETPAVSDSSGTVSSNGYKLNFVTKGEGTPCLVVGSSIYYPKTFDQELYKHFRITYLDMRWFAERDSSQAEVDYTLNSILEDIDFARQELGLDSVIIAGHSVHGNVAYEYAKKYPQHVSKVMMIASFKHFGDSLYDACVEEYWTTADSARQAIQQENWANYKPDSSMTGLERTLLLYNAMSPKYWKDPHYDATWLWEGLTVNETLLAEVYSKLFKNYDIAHNGVVERPVFVAVGDYDFVIPPTMWDTVSYSNFTIERFHDAGHTPQLENPEQFGKALKAWAN